MTETRKLRVFLCHSSQDKPIVRELYQRLNAEGWIDPWLDEKKLLPGQDWDLEIEKAVDAADAVIVCLSNNSVSKEGYVQKELRIIVNKSMEKPEDVIFIIPLRIENCSYPSRLRDYQFEDYFPEAKKKVAYERLSKSLKARLAQIIKRENEDKAKSEEEKKRKREAQKAIREQRKKNLQEKELREKMGREELEKNQLEEKKHFEEEKKRYEEEIRKKEEIVNKHLEEKKQLQANLFENKELTRKQKDEKDRQEHELQKRIKIEEVARKAVEKRLQDEIKKQENFQKNIAFENLLRTILGNATLVGVIAFFVVVFLPLGIASNLFVLVFSTFISGGFVGYRLLKRLPDLLANRAIAICAVGGGVSSLPIIIRAFSASSGWVLFAGFIAGLLGGGCYAYFLLLTDGIEIIRNISEKVLQKIKKTIPFFKILFRLIVMLLVPFVASYLFSMLSLILVMKQQNGLSTEITELVASSRTEMAFLNAGFFSVFYLILLLIDYFYSLRIWNSKNRLESAKLKDNKRLAAQLFTKIGCSLFFWIRLGAAILIYFRLNKDVSPSFFYWIGVFFHPLYLVAFDFLRSFGDVQFFFVFGIQLIPLLILDMIYLFNFMGNNDEKNESKEADNIEKDISSNIANV